jgi:hypothetical protein
MFGGKSRRRATEFAFHANEILSHAGSGNAFMMRAQNIGIKNV